MGIDFEPYADQLPHWPAAGRHVLAQADAGTVVVYQAYNPVIARHAVTHRAFGEGYSYARMSWIKPNFLWMNNRGRADSSESPRIMAFPASHGSHGCHGSAPFAPLA